MNTANLDSYSIKDLQEAATSGAVRQRKTRRAKSSRAARLELIDILSRRSSIGLYILFAASITILFLSVSHSPGRSAVWASMVIASLWVSKIFQSRFRSGKSDNSRPFRWRAEYTSALSVAGVAFASAPELLANNPALHGQMSLIVGLAAICAAMFHVSHLTASMALIAPAAAFFLLEQLARPTLSESFIQISVLGAGVALIILANRTLIERAEKRNPRTGFIRSEVESASKTENSSLEMQGRSSAAQEAI